MNKCKKSFIDKLLVMDLEKLFKLVRREEVILWAGSGLSKYAGYPIANALRNEIYFTFSEKEKLEIDSSLSLSNMADVFVRFNFNNRNALIRLLKEHYNKAPISTKYHSIVSRIPHFKTVITTNYDSLFELAYGAHGQKIYNDINLGYLEKSKTEIFKAHGDFLDPDSIVITDSDYEDYFFNQKKNPLFWNTITERMIAKAILFIGYSLEDQNVNVILKRINQALGSNKREMFLVAPGLTSQKEASLIQKGVHYIDMNGEDFIRALYKDIRKNIKRDFEKGWTNPETFKKFITSINLNASVNFKGESQQLTSLSPNPGERMKGSMTLSFIEENIELRSRFNDFISGRKIEDFIIERGDLENLDLSISGISLIDDTEDFEKFILKHNPSLEGKVKVMFDDYEEFDNIVFKVFSFEKGINLIVYLKNATLKVSSDVLGDNNYNLNFEFKPSDSYQCVNDALFNYEFILRLYSGMGFKVLFYNGNSRDRFSSITPKTSKNQTLDFVKVIAYLRILKEIEKKYNIYFDHISEKEMDFNLLYYIKDVLEGKTTYRTLTKFITLSVSTSLQDFEDYINDGFMLVLEEELEIVTLHGKKIELGFPTLMIRDCFCKAGLKENLILVGSKSKTLEVTYNLIKILENSPCLVKPLV